MGWPQQRAAELRVPVYWETTWDIEQGNKPSPRIWLEGFLVFYPGRMEDVIQAGMAYGYYRSDLHEAAAELGVVEGWIDNPPIDGRPQRRSRTWQLPN